MVRLNGSRKKVTLAACDLRKVWNRCQSVKRHHGHREGKTPKDSLTPRPSSLDTRHPTPLTLHIAPMQGVSTLEVLQHGWAILSVLAIMSILSVTVIIDRGITLRRAKLETKPFVLMVLKLMERDVGAALEHCRRHRQPLARVIDAILLTPGDREAKERAYRHVLRAEVNELQARVPVLGTIGSTAPFIGLFGTVIGIIRAFHDIAKNVGGGPEIVAAGISEALIATAAGLLVAIPAIICYNYFLTRIRRLAEEIDLVAFEVIERVNLENS